MSSENLMLLNSLNWAIIASSALGVFGQYVERLHDGEYDSLVRETKSAKDTADLNCGIWGKQKTSWANRVMEDSRAQSKVNMRFSIIGLFATLAVVCLFNLGGIWIVWHGDTAIGSIAIELFAIIDPHQSFKWPLLIVGLSLSGLCVLIIYQLTSIRARHVKFFELTGQLESIRDNRI